jgi:cytosine/adenosine deaminase-related metal-dependent hydrolase
MNNAVGYAPLKWFGRNSALGTDGFPSDMFEESRLGFFRNAESDHRVGPGRMTEMQQAGHRMVSSFFGREFGTLATGSPADLIVLKYNWPAPVTGRNLPGHFLFGMNSSMVESVMVDGTWVVRARHLVRIHEEEAMSQARKAARKLWRRMRS